MDGDGLKCKSEETTGNDGKTKSKAARKEEEGYRGRKKAKPLQPMKVVDSRGSAAEFFDCMTSVIVRFEPAMGVGRVRRADGR